MEKLPKETKWSDYGLSRDDANLKRTAVHTVSKKTCALKWIWRRC